MCSHIQVHVSLGVVSVGKLEGSESFKGLRRYLCWVSDDKFRGFGKVSGDSKTDLSQSVALFSVVSRPYPDRRDADAGAQGTC